MPSEHARHAPVGLARGTPVALTQLRVRPASQTQFLPTNALPARHLGVTVSVVSAKMVLSLTDGDVCGRSLLSLSSSMLNDEVWKSSRRR